MTDDRPPFRRMLDAVSRTSYDAEYRERFLKDARSAFKEEGFELQSDTEIVLIMQEPKKLHVVVPEFDDSPISLPEDDPMLGKI